MNQETIAIDRHYGRGGILHAIVEALPASLGEDRAPEPADLAPVDEFHNRGRTGRPDHRRRLRPGRLGPVPRERARLPGRRCGRHA